MKSSVSVCSKKVKQENDYQYNHNTYNHNTYKCKKCKIVYTNEKELNKHSYIHMNPIYCYYPNCGKKFSSKHKYQYKQHIDSHKGGINIKCKFCDTHSKTLSSNTLHMKVNHTKDYNTYMSKINEYTNDINKLDSIHITELTQKYININTHNNITQELDPKKEDDPELKDISNHDMFNNLELCAIIALSQLYSKKIMIII